MKLKKGMRALSVLLISVLAVSVCLGFASANPVADECNIGVECGELTDDEYRVAVESLKSGIHSGSFNGENYFSPVSGVQSELAVLPLTG